MHIVPKLSNCANLCYHGVSKKSNFGPHPKTQTFYLDNLILAIFPSKGPIENAFQIRTIKNMLIPILSD